jgi:hypothetical protein
MKSARSNPQDALVSFSSRGSRRPHISLRPQNKDSRNNQSNHSVTLARLHRLVRYSECYVLRSLVGARISKNNLRPRAFIRFYLGSFQPDRRALHPHPPCGLSCIRFLSNNPAQGCPSIDAFFILPAVGTLRSSMLGISIASCWMGQQDGLR